MKLIVLVTFCTVNAVTALATTNRDSKKLFGGYRITPKFCKATRKPSVDLGGPNICMFNHECIQRNGQVVGACMDGFLFGACCQVPDESAGELVDDDKLYAQQPLNDLRPSSTVESQDFKQPSTPSYFAEEKKTTMRVDDYSTPELPLIHISISGIPERYTERPMFRPKPPSETDKYVLVPTLSHPIPNINKTETESIANIIEMLGEHTTTTKKPPSTSYVFSSTYTTKPTTTIKRKPTPIKIITTPSTTQQQQTYSNRPTYHSTFGATPDAFYSSIPTRRPAPYSTYQTPGITVASSPGQLPSGYPSPAPTLIVLSAAEESVTRRPAEPKPVTQLTINNHITQNIYSTQRPPPSTVVITPKPGGSTGLKRPEVEGNISPDDLTNFPPVRNPNLNMSAVVLDENDITTPKFVEDEVLDQKVESFVNNIIEGLQEPFNDLKDVLYDGNKTTSTVKPTKKPATRPVASSSQKPTTKKPTTRPGASTTVTKKPTTNKRTKPTKATTTRTTTISYIEEGDTASGIDSDDYRSQCGKRPLMKTGRIVGGKGATFGEFPWQVLIRELTWFGLFTKNKCGGVLIGNKYVMTAAHCQPGFLASLVAVFGELDISGDRESKRPISRNVKRVIVHRKYDPATFENDLALLELENPIKFDSHILPICLPPDNADFTGRMATVTGWGRLMYGGGVPSVLQEVQVPIMDNQVCQEMFRTAGHSKIILESFLCAGYANGQKDSCEGDSGGPLVLQRPDGRYQLAGTVSHGIKCAAPYLPGVYMRTTYYKPWITSITGLQ